MAYHNIDPRYQTPYVAETVYIGTPKIKNKLTPFRPDRVTMFRSYAASVERERSDDVGPQTGVSATK